MIEVWSWPTPNGHKVHIALEDLGLEYKVIPVNIGAGDQFKPEFLKITANHRIPAIVDTDGPGGKPFTLFESAAILIYLSEKTGGKLIPKDPFGRYKCLEWIMFQMGGVGPMFGQWNHFGAYAPEKIPYAIRRPWRRQGRGAHSASRQPGRQRDRSRDTDTANHHAPECMSRRRTSFGRLCLFVADAGSQPMLQPPAADPGDTCGRSALATTHCGRTAGLSGKPARQRASQRQSTGGDDRPT